MSQDEKQALEKYRIIQTSFPSTGYKYRLKEHDPFWGKDSRNLLGTHAKRDDKDNFVGDDKREVLQQHMQKSKAEKFNGQDLRKTMSNHIEEEDSDKFIGKDKRNPLKETIPEAPLDNFTDTKKGEEPHDKQNTDKKQPDCKEKQGKNEISSDKKLELNVLKNIPYWLASDVQKITIVKSDLRPRQLYLYDKATGFYHTYGEMEFWSWVNLHLSEYNEHLTTSKVRETFNRLLAVPGIQATIDDMDPEQPFVNCLNCVVNVQTGELLAHNPKYLFINALDGNFLDKNYSEPSNYIAWLQELAYGDEELADLLEAITAYMISNFCSAKKFVYLFGATNSGKSEFVHVIERFLGERVLSHIALEDMSEKHTVGEFYGKKVNTCTEVRSGKVIKNTRIIKAHTGGGDFLDANPKGKKHFQYRARTKPIQAANPAPQVAPEADEPALWDRMIPYEFLYSIPENKRQPHFVESLLAKERDRILTYTLKKARSHVDANGFHFFIPASTNLLLARIRRYANSVRLFAETQCVFDPCAEITKQELKNRYMEFCKENGMTALAEITFIKRLCEMFPQLEDKRIHEHADENPLHGLRGIRLRE